MASQYDAEFGWHDLLFRVRSEIPETVAYLKGQHVAEPARGQRATTRIDIEAVRSPESLRELRAVPPPSTASRTRAGGTGATGPRTGVRARLGRGHEIAHALRTRDFRSWRIVTAHEGELGLVATRTVRELVREHFTARGALMLHGAAAVLPDGTGLVLAGLSGAGKTSTAVQVARTGGSCVATDRVLLLPDPDGWTAVGLPMSTRLTAEAAIALGISPDAKGSLIRHGEAAMRRPDPKNKISLSNEEMLRLAGVRFTAATRIDRLMLLENSGAARPPPGRCPPRRPRPRCANTCWCPTPPTAAGGCRPTRGPRPPTRCPPRCGR
ncbi:hypothetical protein NKH77_43700 [Streptomyces sp. M19]